MKTLNKNSYQKQQGIALVMALIMLLLITVIGVASVRISSLDTQISGNSMFSLMVFQGAESALVKVASNDDITNIRLAAFRNTVPVQVSPAYLNSPIETVNGGALLVSSAEIIYESSKTGSLVNSTPNSSKFEYQIFRTTAESKLNATGAQAEHIEGVAILKPPSN